MGFTVLGPLILKTSIEPLPHTQNIPFATPEPAFCFIELVQAARRGTQGKLVVAGSVDSPDRVRRLAEAGANAFTIGSAAFDGSFSPRKGALASQLGDILEAAV